MGSKAVLPVLAALLLSACGGDGGTTTIVSEEPEAEESEAEAPGGKDDDAEPPRERPVLSAAAVRDLERYIEGAPGTIAVAVSPLGEGDSVEAGGASDPRAWSTMKVPLLVALIDAAGGVGELSEAERGQAEAALTASDNEAALALFDRLGALEGGSDAASEAIERVLRRAGDDETEVNTEPSPEGFSTYGQTIWSAEAANSFFGALASGCLLDGEGSDYVLGLMEEVVPDQSWGLGRAPVPGGSRVAFKGGWGPEPDGGYLVRQSGVVTDGDRGYAVSVIAIPDEGGEASFPTGQDLVSEATAMVAEGAGAGSGAAVTCER